MPQCYTCKNELSECHCGYEYCKECFDKCPFCIMEEMNKRLTAKEIEFILSNKSFVASYWIERPSFGRPNGILLQSFIGRSDELLWGIVDKASSSIFNKEGKWEDDPLPSNRDDDFLGRCRFESPEEALKYYYYHNDIGD